MWMAAKPFAPVTRTLLPGVMAGMSESDVSENMECGLVKELYISLPGGPFIFTTKLVRGGANP